MIRLSIQFQEDFDRQFIKKDWGRINANPAMRAGLYVRRVAANSIRRSKPGGKPSTPGKPPRSRYPGHPFKFVRAATKQRFVFGAGQVIVGLVKFPNLGNEQTEPAPGIHEHGLRVTKKIRIYQPRKKGRRITNKAHAKRVRRMFKEGRIKQKPRQFREVYKTFTYPERPFMRPALRRSLPYIARFWRNSYR